MPSVKASVSAAVAGSVAAHVSTPVASAHVSGTLSAPRQASPGKAKPRHRGPTRQLMGTVEQDINILLAFTSPNPCFIADFMMLSGGVHFHLSMSEDPNTDTTYLSSYINWQGVTGFGLTTGVHYSSGDINHFDLKFTPNTDHETIDDYSRFIAGGSFMGAPVPDFRLHSTIHLVMANGVITADHVDVTTDPCSP